jgi:hypothetical protein
LNTNYKERHNFSSCPTTTWKPTGDFSLPEWDSDSKNVPKSQVGSDEVSRGLMRGIGLPMFMSSGVVLALIVGDLVHIETKRALQLYIQRADELKQGGFINYDREKRPIGINITNQEDGTSLIETVGPDNEATKAMIATFRPFIQQKPISFYSIASHCDDPGLSVSWKTQITNIRSTVNSYLDSNPNIIEAPSEQLPTR